MWMCYWILFCLPFFSLRQCELHSYGIHMLINKVSYQSPHSRGTPSAFPNFFCLQSALLALNLVLAAVWLWSKGILVWISVSPTDIDLCAFLAPNTSVAPEEPKSQPWFHNPRLIGCGQAILACHLIPTLFPAPSHDGGRILTSLI